MANAQQARIKILGELAGPKAHRFMTLVLNRIEREAQKNLHGKVLHVRSNRLAGSLTTDVKSQGATLLGSIGTNIPYGKIWEETGIRARIVRARKAKALRFGIGKGGRGPFVFAKSVHIPAQKPRPWLRPAVEKAHPFILALHEKRYKDVLDVNLEVEVKSGTR